MNIGFIGGGKMAQAIAEALVKRGGVSPHNISASVRTSETRELFYKNVGVDSFVTADNREVIERSSVVFLSLKPQAAQEVIRSFQLLSRNKLFISVMAGLSTARIEAWLGDNSRVIRTMPNTPCLIGEGITALVPGSKATIDDLVLVRQLLETTGKVVQVTESMMDSVTSISGSGPAYVYHFIDEMIKAGVEQGLDGGVAQELVIQTVLGATKMIKVTGETPSRLAAKVKSPNGTTVAACDVLEREHWGETLRGAVAAARKRASELSAG